MRQAAAQPIIKTLLDHAASGKPWRSDPGSAPAADYTSPEMAERESRLLFNGRPQVMALSGDLPEPGSFVRRDQFGHSFVVSRGADGVVRTLANVCAHRGAEVVADERGCRRRHSCPYHAWTYDQGGNLVGVPDRESFPDVAVPGPGLVELATVEEHGVIWARPTTDRQGPIAGPGLGELADDFDAVGLGTFRHWNHHRFDQRLNWKLVIDTFLEPYHFASLHRDTVGPIFIPNLCYADRHGDHVRMVAPRRTITALADTAPETWDIIPHSALVYVLFPATVVVVLIDHVETWRVRPHPNGDPNHSITDLDFYVPADTDMSDPGGHWDRNWRLTMDTVREEDFAAMAGVQRGLGSGFIDRLRYGANEPALAMFHRSLAEALV